MKEGFRIGEIAKIKNIDPQTLRYYDKLGVLKPEIIDDLNGYRYYSLNQFMDVDRIKFYKLLGLSLNEIKKFEEINDLDQAMDVLYNQRNILENKIEKMTRIKESMEHIIGHIEDAVTEIKDDKNSIEIKDMGQFYGVIATCSGATNLYAFENIINRLMTLYPQYVDYGHNYKIITVKDISYLDDMDRHSVKKIILPIEDSYEKDSNVDKIHLGMSLVSYYQGLYENRQPTLNKLKQYIQSHELICRGEVYMIPVINKFIVNNPELDVVKIVIPLEEK